MAALTVLGDTVSWIDTVPAGWALPVADWINFVVRWLIDGLDFGPFTFKELTRAIAWLLSQPMLFAKGVFVTGFELGGSAIRIPSMSWVALVGIAGLLGLFAQGWRLGMLLGALFLYLAVFGQWDSAMITMSSVVVAVPFGVVGGLLVGLLAYRSRRIEAMVTPLLDLMQTVPVFAYLTPIVTFFGFGPVAALVATIIFAMPPMVRVTVLALKEVPAEIRDSGKMMGCSRRQFTWQVMVPAAMPTLMIGVNQVIMLSLAMVIIASMIGAGGLGYDVLTALRSLDIGKGLEAGIAITVLAIAFDRLSQALAVRSPITRAERRVGLFRRHPYLIAGIGLVIATTVASAFLPVVERYPESMTLTTGEVWDDLVSWINIHWYGPIKAVKVWIVINLMIPFKRALLFLPWISVLLLLGLAGYRLGGWRLSALVSGLCLFVVLVGLWERTMITVYLMVISVVLAMAVGMPIGVLSARNARIRRVVHVIIDLLQTLPSFVYLIPVVMLFGIGDFSAMIAIVAYAVVPAIRYTDHAVRQVPAHLIEAAQSMGCTRRQILWRVQLPLALPEIMLGVNQTIMMALSMLVITALIGTRDLGQETMTAMSKADTGRSIVAGLCVAFIAIVADRLIGAWAEKRKRQLGLTI